MLDLGEEGLNQHIKTIGLFNSKAKNVIALSQILVDQYEGEVPADRELLQTLPGVGRKTANVVMNCAFGAETFAVDTHIFRVGNRTGLASGKTVLAVEQKRSEEHTSELQSLMRISYAVFCLKKKNIQNTTKKTYTMTKQ